MVNHRLSLGDMCRLEIGLCENEVLEVNEFYIARVGREAK